MDFVKKTELPKQNRVAYVYDLQASQLTKLKNAEKLYNQFFSHYDTTNTSFAGEHPFRVRINAIKAFTVIKDTAIEWVKVILKALTACSEPECIVVQKFYLWAQHNFDNLDLLMDLRLLATLRNFGNLCELPAIETFLVYKYGPYV